MSCDDGASLGDASDSASDGDLSSTDLSVGDRGAKDLGDVDLSPPELGDAPPLLSGYSQTYVVRKQDPQRDRGRNRQVMFRCGNWCYTGEVSFAGLGDGEVITLKDIPRAVPMLQRQQDRLKFFCCADRVPVDSVYRQPVVILAEVQEFVAQELASSRTTQELTKWSGAFHWINDDSSCSTYFELQAELPACMDEIALVACKTYARGLVFITVYQEGSFYVVMQEGEGDQALLDIRFPDVSSHGQGLHLMSYDDLRRPWRKLTLWHAIKLSAATRAMEAAEAAANGSSRSLGRLPTTNLTSTTYLQTYVIMKPTGTEAFGTNNAYRDVLFRFGSWCYSGTVQLTPTLALVDIPHVIPALRMQQSKLDFMCDVTQVPSKSPFAAPLEHMQRLMPLMEEQVASSEEVLTDLLDKLSDMGLEDSVSSWFDGDSMQSFFEFQTAATTATKEEFRGVDLVASKSYSARGVVTIGIWFEDSYYIVLGEGGEEQPLLDSRFPNVSAKGRGYQIRAMTKGPEGWDELRKVSVWQTTAALQQEMEAKMIKARRITETRRGQKESAETRAGGSELDGGGQEGEEHAKATSTIMVEGGAASATNEQGGSTGAGWAGGDRADPVIGGSGGGFAGAIPGTTGGGSAQAEPKHSGAGDRGGVGRGIGAVGADRDHDDRPSRGGGILESKRPWETDAIRGRTNGIETESKDSRGDPPGVSQASASAGAKSGTVIGSERHHAAAKALTNTKVALPHHLSPMAGLEDKLKRMRSDMQNENGDAPWDAFGRPRTALLGTKHK
ncbi:unnamed protein product [Ectocarpus sp. 12 AP-2014]